MQQQNMSGLQAKQASAREKHGCCGPCVACCLGACACCCLEDIMCAGEEENFVRSYLSMFQILIESFFPLFSSPQFNRMSRLSLLSRMSLFFFPFLSSLVAMELLNVNCLFLNIIRNH